MTAETWVTLGALVFTMFVSAVGAVAFLNKNKNEILKQMHDDKESIETELQAIRMSAYEEYRTLRKEISEVSSISRKEFGETVAAIREKVTQIELWSRDQLTDTRHTLIGSIDVRHGMAMEKIETNAERIRRIELFIARKGYNDEDH